MIRLEKMWAIARKEFSEYRRNRYVLMTLTLMPMIITIILPIIYLVPVTALSAQNTEPLHLSYNIQDQYESMSLSNGYYVNATFQNCVLTNVILDNCQVDGRVSSITRWSGRPRSTTPGCSPRRFTVPIWTTITGST